MAFKGNSQQTAPTERKEISLSPITSRLKLLRYDATKIENVIRPSGNEGLMNSPRNSSTKHDHGKESNSTPSGRGNIRYIVCYQLFLVLTIGFLTVNLTKTPKNFRSSLRWRNGARVFKAI